MAYVIPYTPRTPTYVVGKRGRTKTVDAPAIDTRPVPVPVERDNYTPEYWHNLQEYAYTKNVLAKYKEEELTPNDRRALAEGRAKVEAEKEISEVARQHGYKPGRMTAAQWSSLADTLETQARGELRYAMQSDRDAAGEKLRGPQNIYMEVGGKTVLARSGARAADARNKVKEINAGTQESATAYMGQQLVKFGYSQKTVEGLDYQKRRRLLAEIGWGVPQKERISGVSREEREHIINNVAATDRLTARAIAVNPRAGEGMETWTYYEQAALKAGQEPHYLPDLAESDTPDYVLRPSQPARPAPEASHYIDF